MQDTEKGNEDDEEENPYSELLAKPEDDLGRFLQNPVEAGTQGGGVATAFLLLAILASVLLGVLIYRNRLRIQAAWRARKDLRQWIFSVAIWIFATPIILPFTEYYDFFDDDEVLLFTLAVMFVPSIFVLVAKYVYERHIR